MKYSLVFSVILLTIICLSATVEFESYLNLSYPTSNCTLKDIQVIDINNDDQLEIFLMYNDEDNLVYNCFEENGVLLSEKTILGYGAFQSTGCITEFNDILLIISCFITNGFLWLSIHDYETECLLDSIYIDDLLPYEVDIWDIFEVRSYVLNDELIVFASINNMAWCCGSEESQTLRFTYTDSLEFTSLITECGESILEISESQYLITTGFTYDDVLAGLHRYLYYISKNDLQTKTLVYSVYGIHDYSGQINWPYQFKILNYNDDHYLNYGIQLQDIIHDVNGNFVTFSSFTPDGSTLQWTDHGTQIGMGLITASTCVMVNDENHYIMYFRANGQLEIRDRIDGNIVHYQDSDISPFDIKINSAGELLFFENDEENEEINVYKLSEEIYVSADNTQIIISDYKLSNYPNPFNPSTTISFSILENGIADIMIYNIKGQKVKQLTSDNYSIGHHSIEWDGNDDQGKAVSSGIYYYSLCVNGKNEAVKKCLLLK
ncbi:MAG: hypothetical protein DRH89_02445 [Candidatus Cloacimonadota bacterium]|nr:MAG: hypothetical protein DRH89_02445 [Candidatus Cloacimonadota bacterium]